MSSVGNQWHQYYFVEPLPVLAILSIAVLVLPGKSLAHQPLRTLFFLQWSPIFCEWANRNPWGCPHCFSFPEEDGRKGVALAGWVDGWTFSHILLVDASCMLCR